MSGANVNDNHLFQQHYSPRAAMLLVQRPSVKTDTSLCFEGLSNPFGVVSRRLPGFKMSRKRIGLQVVGFGNVE